MKIVSIATFLALVLAAPLGADEPKPIVESIGTLERVLDDRGVVDVYVKLADAAAGKPVITEVTRDGVAVSVTAFRADYGMAGAQTYLHVAALEPARLEAGTYTIGIDVGAPPPPDPQKPSPYRPSSLVLKLKRLVTAAEKATLTLGTLHAERITYIPALHSTWEPLLWTMQESGGKGSVTFDKPQWSVSVKSGDTNPELRTLRVGLASPDGKAATGKGTIGPGETAELVVQPLETSFPFGKLTGTLKLQSPQLTAPAEGTVEIVSRLSKLWLFALLIVSIALGWLTRTRLERERTDAAARIAANEELTRLSLILGAVRDPVYQKKMAARIEELKAALGGDATAVNGATTAAHDALKSLADALAADEKAARDAVAALRAAVHDGKQQTGELRTFATSTLAAVAQVETALGHGSVTAARADAEALQKAVVVDAEPPLDAWRETMRRLLGELGQWPDVAAGDLTPISTAVEGMKVDGLPNLQAAFTAAATVNSRLSARLSQSFLPDLLRLVRRVEEGLSNLHVQAAGVALDTLHDAIEALRKNAGRIDDEPRLLLDALVDLRDATAGALTAASPAGKAPAEIGTRQFTAALAAVQALHAPAVKASAGPFSASMRDDDGNPVREQSSLELHDRPLAPPAEPPLVVTVTATGTAIVGQLVELHATVTSAGETVSDVILQWTAGDRVQVGNVGETTFTFVGQTTDPVAVRVHAVKGARTGDGALTVRPMPAELFDLDRLRRLQQLSKRAQTAVAGTLIVLAGMLIFKDWIGTFPDFLGALFWGFAADVSVGTVIGYTSTLTAKKPFP